MRMVEDKTVIADLDLDFKRIYFKVKKALLYNTLKNGGRHKISGYVRYVPANYRLLT